MIDTLASSDLESTDVNVEIIEMNEVTTDGAGSVLCTVHDWLRFRKLADKWQAERGSSSSLTWITSRPSYLKIIAMSETAIPFLLQELKFQPDLWFAALRSITDENPVTPEIRGNIRLMAAAWIQWGIQTGYLSNDSAL
jgi:hypothetical protein